MSSIKVVLAQLDPRVGDIPGNCRRVLDSLAEAERRWQADLVIFPELTLSGYPPEDLLLRPSLDTRVEAALSQLLAADFRAAALVGMPRRGADGKLYNSAVVVRQGRIEAEYHKQMLPNYEVFDDCRYFAPGGETRVVEVAGVKCGLLVCEDIWDERPLAAARSAGAQVALVLNASPFHAGKGEERRQLLEKRARDSGLPVIYVNQAGAQDELVFDGGSLAVDGAGELALRAPDFATGLYPLEVSASPVSTVLSSPVRNVPREELAGIYQALVLGLRGYVEKNGFPGVLVGLSGGIDSSLTLAVAVDALGPERVEAVMMPFRYTSDMSRDDAAQQARDLGVRYRSISIEPVYDALMAALEDEFRGLPVDTTEENIQARCRGNLLMALSNKKGSLVLTTGNKSEMAVGYATLYGDMAGGFAVLKDVSKTRAYALARYRNGLGPAIPENVISRPPSAELAPDQKDEDSLPPYSVLDRILAAYIEEDASAEAIIARGFERPVVERVLRLVDLNEYKRRQSPLGTRITRRGFGRDRRYPITSGWKIGE